MSQNTQQISQGIQNKIQQIVQNLGTNTGFINQVKQNLVEIRTKLDRVLQSRASLQQKEAENKRQMDNLSAQIGTAKQALTASQAKVTETSQNLAILQRQLQTEQASSKQQLQQLSIERDQARAQLNANGQRLQQLQQQLEQTQQNGQQMQQMIGSLDQQIENIKRVVDTQRALLDPNNSGDDTNLFNHIRGINTILDNILNQGPASPPPSQGSPFSPRPGFPFGQPQQSPEYGLRAGPVLSPQEQEAYNRMMQQGINRQPGIGGKMRKTRRVKKIIKKNRGKGKGKSKRSKK